MIATIAFTLFIAAALLRLVRRTRRPVSRPGTIDLGLARIIASQVAIGTMRNAEPNNEVLASLEGLTGEQVWTGEMQLLAERARTALVAIGLMVANSSGRDTEVMEQLALADTHGVLKVGGQTLIQPHDPPWPTDIGFDGA